MKTMIDENNTTNMYDLDFYAVSIDLLDIRVSSPVNTSNRGAVRSSWKKRVFGPILVQTALILKKKINQSNLIKKISWACGPAAGPMRPRCGPAGRVPAPNAPLLMGTVSCVVWMVVR